MSDKAFTLPEWVPQPLREDPKKTAILSTLMLVLIIVLARCFFSGPAGAQAMIPASPVTADIIESRPDSTTEARPIRGVVRNWVKKPVADLSRNLFAVRSELFPHSITSTVSTLSAGHTFWDALEKSQLQRADEDKQREALAENIQHEAGRLRLQSTIMGAFPQAIISGTMVHEGALIKADAAMTPFRVEKIERQSAVIERDGVRVLLRMTP